MPWEQKFNVVEEAIETLQETHGSSHTAVLGNDGAGPSNTTQTLSNQWQLQLQVEITKREAVERHLKRVEDELNHVKGLVATIQQNQSPPSQNVEQNQPPPSQNVEQNHPPPSQNIEQNQSPVQNLAAHSNPYLWTCQAHHHHPRFIREENLPKRRPRQLWWT